LSVLANTLAMSGDLEAAIAAHQKALAAAQVAFGTAHPETAIIQMNLGDDYLFGLQAERAVTELEKAADVLIAAHGQKGHHVASALTDLGLAYLTARRPKEALETYEKAIAIWSSAFPKHPAYAAALLGREQAKVALGQPLDVAQLEHAAELSADLPPFERGRVLLELGVNVSDAKRARALVQEAKPLLESTSLPLIREQLQRATAWLDR
jgi:tetratricopeptide (TPR) repeat protein